MTFRMLNQSQCYFRRPFVDLDGRTWRLKDLIGNAVYKRDGTELQMRGLFLDARPWDASVFSLERADGAKKTNVEGKSMPGI
jgi:hypothetical protein